LASAEPSFDYFIFLASSWDSFKMHRSTLIAASVGALARLVYAQVAGYGQCKLKFYKTFEPLLTKQVAELDTQGALPASQVRTAAAYP
jgi:hypothetical protein